MPKVTPAYRKAREAEILDAARRAFARYGYDATSIEAILEEAGISRGTLYHYFQSKENLFLSLAAEHFAGQLSELEDRLAAAPSGWMALSNLLSAVLDGFTLTGPEEATYARLDYELWLRGQNFPAIREELEARVEELGRLLRDTIHRGRADGTIRLDVDAESLGFLLLALLDGLQLHQVLAAAEFDWPRLKRSLLSLLDEAIRSAEPI